MLRSPCLSKLCWVIPSALSASENLLTSARPFSYLTALPMFHACQLPLKSFYCLLVFLLASQTCWTRYNKLGLFSTTVIYCEYESQVSAQPVPCPGGLVQSALLLLSVSLVVLLNLVILQFASLSLQSLFLFLLGILNIHQLSWIK